ncbi:MAG TPA: M3 family metallopeptidase [Candidatus Paceibacterota bacterium]|nr:M3 family metallopeptidase [Candidatus Paceibacterota bacterium]
MKKDWKSAKELLDFLNEEYFKVHTKYEKYFWISYMGDRSVNAKKDEAEAKRESFRTNAYLSASVITFLRKSSGILKERLHCWADFFSRYQTPAELVGLRKEISELQTKIETKQASRKEGYRDPYTKKFVPLSRNGIYSLRSTSEDEKIRKACFDALENIALGTIDEYIEMVQKRNQYAQALGYEDFYAYKLAVEEKMTKKELFSLWDSIYESTKYGFKDIRALEKEKPGLRKPWNFGYMMVGSFVKESDPYFPFEEAVPRWIDTFSRLGIQFRGGKIVLDLLDRAGKYNNGFCHWPVPVHYEGNQRFSATAQFTCTVVQGIPGQSSAGLHTLFHEGGHAAHLLNADSKDVCMNTEYPPASTAWDETQSMFLDTISSNIEWRMKYAKNREGDAYPFDLFLRQSEALHPMRPLGLMSIMMISNFEREIYETKNLTKEKVIASAKRNYKKYTDRSVDSLYLLDVPHIYSWESACSYHGYGLATLALTQWRDYFFKKYGYIVDNSNIGKEMQKVWKFGSTKSFPELVKIATGKNLSAAAYIKNVTMSLKEVQNKAKERIAKQATIKQKLLKGNELNVYIELVHGKQKIADSKNGYQKMAQKYAHWLKIQYQTKMQS